METDRPVTTSDRRIIESDDAFESFIEDTLGRDRYAIDTEFHRERSYFPKVALVQINNGDEIALIDPLAVSPEPLGRLFDTDALAILHAASQDLEVFDHWVGVGPNIMFDTQLAAGFTGLSTPSLAALHDKLLRISLPKSSRLTDWLARPLTEDQLAYAASDARLSHPVLRFALPDFAWFPVSLAPRHAMELHLTAREYSGEEAAQVGMINQAFPEEELESRVLDIAKRICEVPPGVVAVNKRFVYTAMEMRASRAIVRTAADLQNGPHMPSGLSADDIKAQVTAANKAKSAS